MASICHMAKIAKGNRTKYSKIKIYELEASMDLSEKSTRNLLPNIIIYTPFDRSHRFITKKLYFQSILDFCITDL